MSKLIEELSTIPEWNEIGKIISTLEKEENKEQKEKKEQGENEVK